MGDVQSVSISSFIAYLLLNKKEITALEIVSFMNEIFDKYNIYVEDNCEEDYSENGDLGLLSCCVQMCNGGQFFKIKDDLNYDSFVGNITVRDYLRLCSIELVTYCGEFIDRNQFISRSKRIGNVVRRVC